jgi:hypothetical protein
MMQRQQGSWEQLKVKLWQRDGCNTAKAALGEGSSSDAVGLLQGAVNTV